MKTMGKLLGPDYEDDRDNGIPEDNTEEIERAVGSRSTAFRGEMARRRVKMNTMGETQKNDAEKAHRRGRPKKEDLGRELGDD